MADVTRTSPDIDASTARVAGQISGLLCGEDIAKGDACCIKTDGKIYRADGSAADQLASFAGLAPKAAKAGEALTLLGINARFRYDADGGLTPGALYYISATTGALADAASTGGTAPVAKAISTTDIVIIALT